jgi:uridine kinase
MPGLPSSETVPAAELSRIVTELLAAPPRAGGTRVLAIDGRSGAGKTTLTRAVRQALDPRPAVVHLDAIYPGWDGLAEGAQRLHEWVLAPLAEERPAGYRRYDWERGEYRGWLRLRAEPVLIVEGVGVGSLSCAPYLSLLVYLDAPEPVRYARAMARDGDTYRPHWQRWADQERALLAGDDVRGRADVVLGSQFRPIG